MTLFDWTDARIAFLQTQWANGLSASEIAAGLDLKPGEKCPSRCAVSGKLHRLGEKRQGAPVRGLHGQRRTYAPRRNKDAEHAHADFVRRHKRIHVHTVNLQNKRESRKADPGLVQKVTPIMPTSKPVLFLRRRERKQCATIIDDNVPIEKRLCCGAPIPEGSFYQFCEWHAAQFLVPNKRAA